MAHGHLRLCLQTFTLSRQTKALLQIPVSCLLRYLLLAKLSARNGPVRSFLLVNAANLHDQLETTEICFGKFFALTKFKIGFLFKLLDFAHENSQNNSKCPHV